MMKAKMLITPVTIMMALSGFTAVQAKDLQNCPEPSLTVALDATYVSRYLWRGYNFYENNHSAFQPSVDVDLFGTGFGLNVWTSMANGSGFEDDKEIDYTFSYSNSLFDQQPYATKYSLGWVDYTCPGKSRQDGDMQELYLSLAWPEICPLGVTPYYTAAATWPSKGGGDTSANSGWFHIVGLCYDLTLANLPDDQALHLSAETIYNDGAYGSDHDWSHAVFGVSTDIAIAEHLTFSPGVYYQCSWEDTVNTQDEYWFSLSLTYAF